MKKEKFVQMSKNMVKEYFNRYISKTENVREITDDDVMVIKFHNEPNKYQIMLTVMTSDDVYYGVTYDKNTENIYSYIYGKDGLRTIGRKERFNV